MNALSIAGWFETVTVANDHGHFTVHGASSKPDHVCVGCRRQHKHGAKTYDAATRRCRPTKSVADCRSKPVVSRPHAWVGKGACSICGATIPRGTTRCKNAAVCTKRGFAKLHVIDLSAEWETAEYERVMDAQREPVEMAIAA